MSDLPALSTFQRFRRLLEVDKKDITQVYVYAFFNGLVNLSLPLGIQAIINLIQGGETSSSWIVLVVLVLLGIAFNGVLQLMQFRIVENISQKIFSRASFEFAYRIPRILYKNLYNYYPPELANRFFDTLTIQKGLPKILIDFSLSVFQILAGLLVLSLYHPFFILYGLGLIALVYTILLYSGPRGLATSLKESKYKYDMAHWLEEIARAKMTFTLTSNSPIALEKTDDKVVQYLNARESHFKILVQQFIQLIGFKVLIAAGLLIIGGLLVFRQEMNIGQFVAAEIIIIIIINSVEKLIRSLDSVYDVLTALEKIGYVTDMEMGQVEGLPLELNDGGLDIVARGVSYIFPDAKSPTLKDINFNLNAGQSVCLVGPNGSGKSTLMHLLSGILDPTEGAIQFNGIAFPAINTHSLRKHVGYALSTNQIFLGTLLENITMNREGVTLEDVLWAIKEVKLDEFIAALPKGLSTFLDPEGRKMPRNVVNKIILARAIVTKPALLIMEDPLEHVEPSEKNKIIENITSKDNSWSIIVTSIDAIWTYYIKDLLVLEKGEIVQSK